MLRASLVCVLIGCLAIVGGCGGGTTGGEADAASMDGGGSGADARVDTGSGDVDSGGTTDVDSGGTTDVDSGGATDLDSGGTTDVDSGGATDVDGGTSCVDTGCGLGQECCAATGSCYASGCLACCMPRPGDAGLRTDGGGPRPRDGGGIVGRDGGGIMGRDAGASCVDTGCGLGQECCAGTGRCYDPRCLSCCMFP